MQSIAASGKIYGKNRAIYIFKNSFLTLEVSNCLLVVKKEVCINFLLSLQVAKINLAEI